jgi:hypothetical protein
MAIPNTVTLTIRDRSGDIGKASFFVQPAFSLAQFNEMAELLANATDAVVGGVIEGANMRLPADITAITGNTVGATSDVGDVGQLQFRTVENRPVRVNIPGISESLVAANSDDLDTAAPAMAALLAAFEDGLTVIGGTMSPCNRGEDDITVTEFARERFRNRGERG